MPKSVQLLRLILLVGLSITAKTSAEVRFNRDIRPILSDNCFACHGPDAMARDGKLRLDVREDALKALVPGKPEASDLLARVLSKDADAVMPPPKTHKKLTRKEIAKLREWIASGAEYEGHWAFLPIRDPQAPAVKSKWVRNEIDQFVLRRLRQEKLKPAAMAERRAIIRRATLDLIGLPPTPEEVEAFVAAKDFDQAYADLLARLQKSPRYGEHQAWSWLDAARYADSDGYESDPLRNMWPWRDWVVRAFNDGKPFDEFIVEQLAGDMLPEPTLLQQLATGFNRNHRLNNEGGIEPEEWRIEYVADRAETTATVFLGLTWGCARCHDHKYDPVTRTDYYSLFAFFNNLEEIGNGRGANKAPPMLDMPGLDQLPEFERLTREIAPHEAKLAKIEKTPAFKQAADAWLPTLKEKENAALAKLFDRRPFARWGAFEKNKARRYFLENLYEETEPFRRAYLKLKAEQTRALRSGSKVMVMADRAKPRETFMLDRGVWNQPTTKVTAATPAFLPPLNKEVPRNRLGLARWLVGPENPLTARVLVNRVWEHFFGVGIVKTQEDFGSQGEPPSHPDLLDHLASRFMKSDWDFKALQREIMMSATYLQSSAGTAESFTADPENRLLSRGPRFRLSAQVIRDQALAASGLLVNQLGGPPVKPYQPDGLWREIIKGRVEYKRDSGEKLYRRSLYTLWRRAVKPPEMLLFDANERDTCSVSQKRTNTPLQALVLLNDVTFVEAARGLAARMIREAGEDAAARIDRGMQLLLGRRAKATEREVLLAELSNQSDLFKRSPEAVKEFLAEGESAMSVGLEPVELAAYTAVARILLNLDETITKE